MDDQASLSLSAFFFVLNLHRKGTPVFMTLMDYIYMDYIYIYNGLYLMATLQKCLFLESK